MSNSGAVSFPEHINGGLLSQLPPCAPYTAAEYYSALLGRAIQASRDGDYGIGAALVVRYPDVELVVLARNTVISQRDPLGHAESNAIRQLHDFLRLDASARLLNVLPWIDPVSAAEGSGNVFVRPASPVAPASPAGESVLYATLEPCPLCTVAIMNSRIENVIIATPDELGGALAPRHLEKLPEIIPRIVASQGMSVKFASTKKDSDPCTYIPEPLSALLERIFWDTKEACDAKLAKGVLFEPGMHAILKALL
jgi:tRNA(Arg) A34 adenosine deaminase TadA